MAQQTSPDSDHDPSAPILIKVGTSSPVKEVASSIAHNLYDRKVVKVRAIGAGAVNQAAKACAIARGYVGQRGLDLNVRPGFETVPGDEGDASALVFICTAT